MPPVPDGSILALDVGTKRIGVAYASLAARIASPLTTLANGPSLMDELQSLFKDYAVSALVVGLPRNLAGESTEQTHDIEAFTQRLTARFSIPVHFQDEAVTSRQAEAELKTRGKLYSKGDIDALAATYILEDYLQAYQGEGTV